MDKKRILLTGANGMVGKNILENSQINKFEMIAPSSAELDLRNYEAVEKYILKSKPEMVIHLAGKVGGIQANIKEPVNFLLENLDMGMNIVKASRNNGIKYLLNLGSSCMYPKESYIPLTEDMILKGELEPTNEGYAIAKIVIARLCEYISREDNKYQYKTLIPCNLYGRYDKFDPVHSHLIPAIIHKMHEAKINNIDYVEIWGDGSARREFMYSGDLAEIIIKAINNFDALPNYMNIGLGYDFSIDEFYKVAAEVIGFTGKFVHDRTKPIGMMRKLVNINHQINLGWNCKVELKEGLNKTYDFYLKGP